MIRTITAFLLAAACTLSLLAGQAEREILLTPSGTLFTVESAATHLLEKELDTSATRVLRLTIHDGDEESSVIVPASLASGRHTDPALAYDADSDTLFIFWQRSPNQMGTELLFTSYQGGVWSTPTSISAGHFTYRSNLRITATKYVDATDDEGETRGIRTTVIHAVWWELSGYGEEARYALLVIDQGRVASIEEIRLLDIPATTTDLVPAEISDDFPRELFRNPALIDKPRRDEVEVIFADWEMNRFNRATIRPIIENGVIRVPDGIARTEFDGPRRSLIQANGRITVIPGGGDSLAFYNSSENGLSYQVYRDGAWTDGRTIAASSNISHETAVEALRRRMTDE